jgi:hypothetical protein
VPVPFPTSLVVKNGSKTFVRMLSGIPYPDPRRLQGVSVYREGERSLSAGERVQFTAPYRAERIANRQLGTIDKVASDGNIQIRLDSGLDVSFNLPHLDHGYAVTGHSSQDATVDKISLLVRRASTARKSDPAHHFFKTRIGAQRLKVGNRAQPEKHGITLLKRFLQPLEGAVSLPQPRIKADKRLYCYVSPLEPGLQLVAQRERGFRLPRPGVCMSQVAE